MRQALSPLVEQGAAAPFKSSMVYDRDPDLCQQPDGTSAVAKQE